MRILFWHIVIVLLCVALSILLFNTHSIYGYNDRIGFNHAKSSWERDF